MFGKNGRINERNIGRHRLDGGAKRSKPIEKKRTKPFPDDAGTDHAWNTFEIIEIFLDWGWKEIPSGYKSDWDDLMRYWLEKGIIKIEEQIRPNLPTFIQRKNVYVIVEEYRHEIELFNESLKRTFHLERFIED